MKMITAKQPSFCLFALLASFTLFKSVASIGVNYGTLGDNLAKPSDVARFIKDKTIIDRVKIFDTNSDIIKAFANTGVVLSITIANNEIPNLANKDAANKWVDDNIKAYPKTKFGQIYVGNELTRFGLQPELDSLLKAMWALHNALNSSGLGDIKVTTPHALSILTASDPPSKAKFDPKFEQTLLKPLLSFHRSTKSPFTVNVYPFFSYNPGNDSFILGRKNPGHYDPGTKITYMDVYDSLLDATYTAMKSLGFGDVEIAVGEVGWPTVGEPWLPWVNVDNAQFHNKFILDKSESGKGTPLMPGRKFETYIFALFNENQKPGAIPEKNFGLFRPDFTPVYDIGIMNGKPSSTPAPAPVEVTSAPASSESKSSSPSPSKGKSSPPSPSDGSPPSPSDGKSSSPSPADGKSAPTSSKIKTAPGPAEGNVAPALSKESSSDATIENKLNLVFIASTLSLFLLTKTMS